MAEVADGHRQQRHRDALTGGEEHVELATGRKRGDLLGQLEQLVGGVAHRGDDDDDLMTRLGGGHDPLRYPLDGGGIGDRGTPVLLDDQAHAALLLPAAGGSVGAWRV